MIVIVWNSIFSQALLIDATCEKSVIHMYMLITI